MATTRYIFPCPRGHKVAVDPTRYWSRARCPVCGGPVDASRSRRTIAWLKGSAPRSRLRVGKLTFAPFDGVAWGALLFILLVALIYYLAGDRTWWGTALIYTGKWPWLAIPLLLSPFAILWRPSALVPLALSALVVLGFLMGGEVSVRPLMARDDKPLRVLTFNTEGGFEVGPRLGLILERYQPDIAAFQECGPVLREAIMQEKGWEVADTGRAGICFMSRYPLTAPPVGMPASVFRDAGGSASVVRYPIATPQGPLTVFNLHLETPRHGVEYLLSNPSIAPSKIRANNLLRETESRVVRRWVDSTEGPKIIVGDFNLPVESAIFRDHWGDLEDAWDAAGNGFGFTKNNGWIRVRIDHALTNGPLRAVRAVVGDDFKSDHLPVIVDYGW